MSLRGKYRKGDFPGDYCTGSTITRAGFTLLYNWDITYCKIIGVFYYKLITLETEYLFSAFQIHDRRVRNSIN